MDGKRTHEELKAQIADLQQIVKGQEQTIRILKEECARYKAAVEDPREASDHGKPAHRDTTAGGKAEEALRESEERFHSLSELLPEAIFEMNLDGRLTFVNRFAFEQFRYSLESFEQGLNAFDMIVPEDRQRAIENAIRIADGENIGLQAYRGLKADGTTFPILIHASAISCGGVITGLRGVVIDITEQQKADEEREKMWRLLDAAILNSPSGIIIADAPDVTIRIANRAALSIRGQTPQALINIDIHQYSDRWQFFRTDGSPYPPQELPLSRAVLQGDIIQNAEVVIRDDQGLPHLISANAAPLHDTEGHIVAGIMVFHDITERKRLETQVLQAQKMEAIGTLTGGVAHDFNNLLMGIQGRVSLVRAEMGKENRLMEHLNSIEEYVNSATALTRQLLGFAKGGKYETRPTDLNALVKLQNNLFGRTRKEIRIHEKFAKSLWIVEIDRGQMEQVLLNLYVNAWQAMPDGGDLFVETANCEIDDQYLKPFQLRPGRYVKLSVTDTGMGMDPEIQSRIFEPFFTTKERGRGTGLGLASAYGIIKNHGGFINVYSEKGSGTTFTIYLPASDKKPESIQKLSMEIVRGTETVLLVDDEQLIIDVGTQLLEKLGYRVIAALGGRAAVKAFHDHGADIHLVILDMIMPEMGGAEVFDRIKAMNPEVKVLLSSGYSLNGQAADILQKGCNSFIQKPFNLAALSQKVREVLEKI